MLKTQHLAILGAKNKLKTNSISSAKSADQKAGFRTQDKERADHRGSGLGTGGWGRKSRCRVSGTRRAGVWRQVPDGSRQKSGYLDILCGRPAAPGLPPARAYSPQCAKRDEQAATGQAAQRIRGQPGMRLLLLGPRLSPIGPKPTSGDGSTSGLREIERTKLECLRKQRTAMKNSGTKLECV